METLYSAKQDFLTNCYTRESINPYLDKLFAENKAYDKEFSIILLDVDHFKSFNDKYGHLYGDEVLKYFSSSIRLGLANVDSTVFRFGGDEFIIVLPEKNVKEAYRVAVELHNTLKSRPFLLSGKLIKMSFSGGVVSCATDGDSPEKLIANADKAMYVSKKRGRARATVYSRIWLDRIRTIVTAFVVAAIIGVVALGSALFKSGSLPKFSGSLQPKTFTGPFKSGGAFSSGKGVVTVRLKSGSVIKGRIVKENDNEIEVSLSLDKGEGSLTIKKSNIKNIERD
jgi:diguanylate cyclase (GGDEF)-like protein